MKYFKELFNILNSIEVTNSEGELLDTEKSLENIISHIYSYKNTNNKIITIGNGGSAAIANHLTIDLLKGIGVAALSLSDSAQLTCLSNDLGYENAFKYYVNMFIKNSDTLIAISSSGKSKNILNAVNAASEKGCKVITLSGFDKNNSLRKNGNVNIYVSSNKYGYVELCHQIIAHYITDSILKKYAD